MRCLYSNSPDLVSTLNGWHSNRSRECSLSGSTPISSVTRGNRRCVNRAVLTQRVHCSTDLDQSLEPLGWHELRRSRDQRLGGIARTEKLAAKVVQDHIDEEAKEPTQ
jgi:hypothetical protein